MKASQTIQITDFLQDSLNTREAVHEISKLIEANPCQVVELDFTGVDFMSRSFADELHKEKIRLQKEYAVRIDILNANEEVMAILEVVARTQNKQEKKAVEVPVYKFSNPELVFNYLLTI